MTTLSRWCWPVVVAVLTAIALVAVFHMQLSAGNYDPQYMRVLVERTMRFGGSYYVNGIHNKGPLEPAIYELAGRLGGRTGFWFVIALFTMATSLVIGLAAAIVVARAGGARIVGISMAVLTVTHLTLSNSDYAGVLYSRNIVVGLLALAFVVGAWDDAWRTPPRRIGAVLVSGLAIGLAAQTLLSSCFTAAPVLAWVAWTRRRERVRSCPAWLAVPIVAVTGFLSVPLYYRIFGPWDAFVESWWTYARWMNTATGRSLGGQFGLGVDQFAEYYSDRPVVFVAIVAFFVDMAVRWRSLDGAGRALRAMLGAWWLAAWIELALSQRYSSHYYSILAVPTLLMLAAVVGGATRRLRLDDVRTGMATVLVTVLPLLVAIGTIHFGGTQPFREGFREASAFDGFGSFEEEREQLLDGRSHMMRAALDLVSEPNDPLLMWTSYPWPYLNLHRVSATRYIWKNFLLGEIYLARSGPEYVLPGSWETFVADVERTDPTAFIVEAVNPVVPGTPYQTLVDERFTTVFSDDVATLEFRNDLAAWLRSPPVDPVAVPALDLVRGAPAVLDDEGCARFDGEIVSGDPDGALVSFGFRSPAAGDGVTPTITFARTGENSAVVTSRANVAAPFSVNATVEPTEATEFTLVVGARAAVLMVGGEIVGAVETDGRPPITVEAASSATRLDHLVRSAPAPGSGC